VSCDLERYKDTPTNLWKILEQLPTTAISIKPTSPIPFQSAVGPDIKRLLTTMAFVLRRPFAISATLKQIPKPSKSTTARFFHQNGPFTNHASRSASPTFAKYRQTFQGSFKRSYIEPSYRVKPDTGNATQKIIYGAAIIGGTMVATNFLFNRETREDGGMAPYERSYLNQTFMQTGLGIGIIGVAARALHASGWSYRLMAMNPWVVVGVSLVGSIGSMYATLYTPPER
jgi:hypothetical protein